MTTARTAYQPLPQRPALPAHASEPQNDDDEGSLLDDNEQYSSDARSPVGGEIIIPARLRWINFVLGAAILLPWNAIITAMPYFLSRLSGSAFQSTFSSYLSATFTFTGFCFLGHATATSKQSNFSRQIRRSLLVLTLLLLLLTASTLVPLPAKLFFILVLLNGVCQSAAGAYLQSAVVAVASLFGPSAILPVMSGQAAVGVLISLVQLLSAAAGIRGGTQSDGDKDAATRAALIFFTFSTVFLASTIASHSWIVTLPVYQAVVAPFEAKKDVINRDREPESLTRSGRSLGWLPEKGRIVEVAKMNAEFNFAVFYVFMVTLSVFPPITSSIQSVHPPSASFFSHPLIFTALHFFIFNIGDFIGRTMPALSRFQIWSSRRLLFMSLSRTLFIPLFLLCNVQRPSSSPSPVPVGALTIKSDILFFLILLFFGVTNGWIGSLVMIAAPSIGHNSRLQHRPEDIDTAATIAQFCLVGGLAVGSFMSFGVKGAICACNPFTT